MMTQTESKVLSRLKKWEQKEGALPELIKSYRELLRIQSRVKAEIAVERSDFDEKVVRDRLAEGKPLLMFQDFSPDWRQVHTIFQEILAWASQKLGASPSAGKSLREIGCDISDLRKLAEIWYLGHSSTDKMRDTGVDGELLSSVIAAALKPFLSAYAELLLPRVKQELWRRRYCPVCGGSPDFAYLNKERGTRWLLCSRCDAEWLFQRLECPYCGNQKQDALAYFVTNEEPCVYRLYVCEQCRTYIKAIDLRNTGLEILLPLERVMTLDMDRQAQKAGYRPGSIAS